MAEFSLTTLLNLALAITPGIAISIYIYYRDIHEKEPHRFLIICFIFGMLSTVPAYYLEVFGTSLGITESPNILMTLVFAFVVVAGVEEFVKFIFLRFYIYPNKEFDEPLDGIVYAVIISMGFATLENILYVYRLGTEVAILRMFTAVPAHAAFAVIMGYYVGLAKEAPKHEETSYLFFGYIGAVILHGTYDFFLFQENFPALTILAFVALIAGIYYGRLLIKHHQDKSPHKPTAQNEQRMSDDEHLIG